jgi:hypothetical protein
MNYTLMTGVLGMLDHPSETSKWNSGIPSAQLIGPFPRPDLTTSST